MQTGLFMLISPCTNIIHPTMYCPYCESPFSPPRLLPGLVQMSSDDPYRDLAHRLAKELNDPVRPDTERGLSWTCDKSWCKWGVAF